MADDTPDLTFVPVEPRPFSSDELQLIEFLLEDPLAVPELRAQVGGARVVSRCGCGCASVGVQVPPEIAPARWRPGDTPSGRPEWAHLTAEGLAGRGRRVEVTLHVLDGYIGELEIWSGRFGESVRPRPETLRRLPL